MHRIPFLLVGTSKAIPFHPSNGLHNEYTENIEIVPIGYIVLRMDVIHPVDGGHRPRLVGVMLQEFPNQ
eukprot:scaffold249327_cov53-Cyclotella_meneghiniana.AAC.1